MSGFHLAQLNVARLLAPLEAPQISGYRDNLERVNALADAAPGFLWRATGTGFDSHAAAQDIDPWILANMSLWESAEALAAFAYRSDHRHFVRDGHQWFERQDAPYMVLWWLPPGELPQRVDAFARLDHLRAHGTTPHAFDFPARFPAPVLMDASE